MMTNQFFSIPFFFYKKRKKIKYMNKDQYDIQDYTKISPKNIVFLNLFISPWWQLQGRKKKEGNTGLTNA